MIRVGLSESPAVSHTILGSRRYQPSCLRKNLRVARFTSSFASSSLHRPSRKARTCR